MSRTIFALGGGSFGEHIDTYKQLSPIGVPRTKYCEINTTPIDKLILKTTGKSVPYVLLVLTASEDGEHDLNLLVQAFKAHYENLGAEIDTLRLVTGKPPMDEIKRKIMDADAIYASGGSTFLMMRTWRRLGVDKLLRTAYENGTVVSGMSAGSICWFRYGNSNSFYNDRPFRVSGLNWHPLLICPHYDTETYRQPAMKKIMKRTPKTMGITLDEHAAIEIKDETYKIHLFKLKARVHKSYWHKGRYVLEVIEPQKSYSPLSELMMPFDLSATIPAN